MSYLPSTVTRTITVEAVGVSLSVTPITGEIGDTFTFSGDVIRDTTPVTGLAVTVYLDAERIATGTTDATGHFEIPWVSDRSGRFDCHAYCMTVTSPIVTISITRIATIIMIDPLPTPIYVNTPFTLSGQLREFTSGIGLEAEAITLSYDGIAIGTVTTGADGYWSTSVTIPTTGTYSITAEWPGDATHTTSITHTPSFTVEAIATALTIVAPENVLEDGVFTVFGGLTRVDTGEAIAGQTIHLSYDTVIIGSAVTAADGGYSIEASIPTTGTYTLKAEFLGTASAAASFAVAGIGVGVAAPPLDLPTIAGIALAVVDAALIVYAVATQIPLKT